VFAAAVVSVTATPYARACADKNVRDSAYSERRDVHRLCVIGRDEDDAKATAITERLAAWLAGPAKGLNVELERVDANDPEIDWAGRYGIPSAPPKLPVTMLVGTRRIGQRRFYIDHWEPEPSEADLAVLLSSPGREAIRREVGRRTAVLVHIPADRDGTARVDALYERLNAKWRERERLDLAFVRIDRDDPRERTLLSFVGARPGGPDWLGVVFGRGKFMAPLTGGEIDEAGVDGQLYVLVAECTCLRTASGVGVDMPMVWTDADEAKVETLFAGAPPPGDVAQPATQPAPPPVGPPVGRSMLGPVAWSLGGLAIVAGAASLMLILRKNR
jgi:hypothetical protein